MNEKKEIKEIIKDAIDQHLLVEIYDKSDDDFYLAYIKSFHTSFIVINTIIKHGKLSAIAVIPLNNISEIITDSPYLTYYKKIIALNLELKVYDPYLLESEVPSIPDSASNLRDVLNMCINNNLLVLVFTNDTDILGRVVYEESMDSYFISTADEFKGYYDFEKIYISEKDICEIDLNCNAAFFMKNIYKQNDIN